MISPSPQKLPTSYFYLKGIFLCCVIASIIFNAFYLFKETAALSKSRKENPFFFSGSKFEGLGEILKSTGHVGYYTDKDFSNNQHVSQFAQAQYVLAPIVLDLNSTQRRFVLFDCTSEEIAFAKIKEIGYLPLKKNQYGIILAEKSK